MPLTGRCTRLRSGGLRQFLPLVGRFKFIIFVAVLICCKLSCCDEAVNNRLYIILYMQQSEAKNPALLKLPQQFPYLKDAAQ